MPSPEQNWDQSSWGSLIKPDKSPAPLLEQLCLGIANLISKSETFPSADGLVPQNIAAFYRAVGGNYDTLFLSTPHSSLSFIYQSLGCYHILQPSSNAFERPCVPTLLPNGWVRWLTIQLLLGPDEHAGFLQEAVRRFDIINPSTGATFPKDIPRDAFPVEADAEMVKWHDSVSQRLEQEYQAQQVEERRASRNPSQYRHEQRSSGAGSGSRRNSRHRPAGQQEQQTYFTDSPSPRARTTSRNASRSTCFRRPSPLRTTQSAETPPESDRGVPKYTYIDRTGGQTDLRHSRRSSGHSSSQPYTRGRSDTPRRKHYANDASELVDYSSITDDTIGDGDEDGLHWSPRSRMSRSAEGRVRRRNLHSRLLSPDSEAAGRRHSHDSPLSRRNRSISSQRRSRDHRPVEPVEIDIDILSSDTEVDAESSGHHHRRQRATRIPHRGVENADVEDVGNERQQQYTSRARRTYPFLYNDSNTPSTRSPNTHASQQNQHQPERIEYVILSSPSYASSPSSSSSSSSSSPSSPIPTRRRAETPTPSTNNINMNTNHSPKYIVIDPVHTHPYRDPSPSSSSRRPSSSSSSPSSFRASRSRSSGLQPRIYRHSDDYRNEVHEV